MAGEYVLELSVVEALVGAFSLSFFFVASLYMWTLLGYADEDRDDPRTIKHRFISTTLTCCCAAALVVTLSRPAGPTGHGFSQQQLLGLQSEDVGRSCLVCVGLTALLFLGPLAQHLLSVFDCDVPLFSAPGDRWISLRNLLMAPITEEFVFRACLARLWVAASIPHAAIIACGPFFFALAHVHHFLGHLRRFRTEGSGRHGAPLLSGQPWSCCDKHVRKACTITLFQVFYTSLFGAYASFLLLRTGSTVAVILAHSFCNHQGFPDLSFVGAGPEHHLHHRRGLIGGFYVLGLVSWAVLLDPATRGFASPYAAGGAEAAAS